MSRRRGVCKVRVGHLQALPSLAAFSDDVLADLDAHGVEAVVPAGRTLCSQGGVVRQAYLILSGSAAVTQDNRLVGTCGAGDLVGELALVDGLGAPETVVALTDIRALVMSPSEFAVMFEHPVLASRVARLLAERVRASMADVAIAADRTERADDASAPDGEPIPA